MVVQLQSKTDDLISGENLKILREYEMEAVQTAYDWGFDEEVLFPTIYPTSMFQMYTEEQMNLLLEAEVATGKTFCFVPEYRTVINNYSTNIWADKKDYSFFYSGKVISYENADRTSIKEDYIIGVHCLRPPEVLPAYNRVCKWMVACGKAYDSKGFKVETNKIRTLDFLYNGKIVGFAKNDLTSLGAVLNLTELIKQF
jgi:hypothetical protein